MPDTQTNTILEKFSRTPATPGVYLMKNAEGDVIYVGKAGNLKKRLASYFSKSRQPDLKTGVLVKQIAAFDLIITKTQNEALILESNLIKRYRPRYNVILKDDKRYPSLRLDIRSPFPVLTVVRKIKKDHALYFGPFSSATAVRRTLKFINKTFKLRKCSDRSFRKRSRPCLFYQMNACLAPCCFPVDKTQYNAIVKEVVLFLKGRTPDLIRRLKRDMHQASESLDFEYAATIRDKIHALESTLEKQVSVITDFKDRDVIGLNRSNGLLLLTVLFVRGGFLLGSRHFSFMESMATDEEIIDSFVRQYYEKARFIPKEVLVPVEWEHMSTAADILSDWKGRRVDIIRPRRGEKKSLIDMALQNAQNALKDLAADAAVQKELLERLQKRLKLGRFPKRIECVDNSNISGTNPVAGLVVFENGKPFKSGWRKYNIKTVDKPDDYGTMYEVLSRRYGDGGIQDPLPDLLMLDGGKGQLNIAVAVLKDLGIKKPFDVISIAKKNEKKGETQDKIYSPGRANPITFGKETDLLLFLENIRDETHRFAVTFHRRQRSRTSMASVLDTIPGIGKKRRDVLLRHFGGIENIRAATPDELSALPGMNRKAAESVLKTLNG